MIAVVFLVWYDQKQINMVPGIGYVAAVLAHPFPHFHINKDTLNQFAYTGKGHHGPDLGYVMSPTSHQNTVQRESDLVISHKIMLIHNIDDIMVI